MARGFVSGNRRQLMLLPPSIEKWVPKNHPVRFVLDCVRQMNLQSFYAKYGKEGRPAYDPEMMLSVLLYAYSKGIRSSRKIAEACKEQLPYIWLTGNRAPDHCTIARFRQRHEAEMREVFVEVLRLCHKAGLVRLGELYLDGTKIKANASLSANKKIDGLKEEMRKILEEARQADLEEDEIYGEGNQGNELPKELCRQRDRLERIREAKERLEEEARLEKKVQEEKLNARAEEEEREGKKKRGRKPKEPEECVNNDRKANITDPESRIMKDRKGYLQGYNAQAVCTKDQIIVSAEVTQQENDVKQLEPMIEESVRELGEAGVDKKPKAIVADAGYFREDIEWRKLEGKGCRLYLATRKAYKHRRAAKDRQAPRGRIPNEITTKELMERRLLTKEGRGIYKLRSQTIEPVFGQIKRNLGVDSFLRRGLKEVKSEWELICAVFNLKKLMGHLSTA
jgi:transposase